MDQMTQQNAAMVEETNAATQGLSGEALRLEELVSRFRLDASAAAPHAAPAPDRAAAPALATKGAQPAASPARALGQKIARAFGGGQATAAPAESWTEF
ncbi:hypothetical protein AWJ14_03880 [Hoeflea olei]|uniref:Methyl-accepting transducer domain-containing protein n=2 Tax=Hoeflea olei TaxID=1480615 RepID=A0A1C1YWX9_9HYPH|nr:hypothetical protein AWJ14_03880 [Hoeflea olei]